MGLRYISNDDLLSVDIFIDVFGTSLTREIFPS